MFYRVSFKDGEWPATIIARSKGTEREMRRASSDIQYRYDTVVALFKMKTTTFGCQTRYDRMVDDELREEYNHIKMLNNCFTITRASFAREINIIYIM